MDKHSIGSLITDLSLPTIAAHWRSLTVPQLLKSQVNHVYAMDCPEQAAILRLTHSSQRSEDLIRGELEWIEFLAARDIAVSHPLRTRDDRLTLRLDYGDTYFTATAFAKAPGALISTKDPAVWNADLMVQWGTLLGRIHALTHRYAPSSPALKRPTWSEDELLLNAERYAAPAFPNLTRDLETHLDWLSTLPQDPHSFGLVHGDANWGNFHVHQDQITLFDFDDCCYHWFIYDFAIPMYYFALYHDGIDEDRLRFFFDPFVRGYLSEHPLPLSWFDLLPRFCSFRDILLTLFACKTQMSPDHLFYQSVTRNYTLGNHLHNFDFTAFQQSACNV